MASSGINWNISSKEISLQNEAWKTGEWETNEARGTENTQDLAKVIRPARGKTGVLGSRACSLNHLFVAVI